VDEEPDLSANFVDWNHDFILLCQANDMLKHKTCLLYGMSFLPLLWTLTSSSTTKKIAATFIYAQVQTASQRSPYALKGPHP
jgi:hypothetical protein